MPSQLTLSLANIDPILASTYFLVLNLVILSILLIWGRGIYVTLWLCGRFVISVFGFVINFFCNIGILAMLLLLNVMRPFSILVKFARLSDWISSSTSGLLKMLERPRRPDPVAKTTTYQVKPRKEGLSSSEVLGWEFDYIRNTASEAMKDRHTMVNFYLLIAAVIVTGVVAVVNPQQISNESLPLQAGTVLLWALSGIGWFYLLKIIRLREAWHDSARAMNQIKNFYILHSKEFPDGKLLEAFRWSMDTMPRPDQQWNVFFYSAALIGFLNSLAFALGGVLLSGTPKTNMTKIESMTSFLDSHLLIMIGLALVYFAFHVLMYFAFLKPRPR